MNKGLLDLLTIITSPDDSEVERSFTHSTIFSPAQKWIIRPHKIGIFWDKYAELIDNKALSLCIAEKNDTVIPLIMDFKFCFDSPEDPTDTDYDEPFLMTLICCIQQVLLEALEISDNRSELLCCALESEHSWVETNIDESRILCRSLRLQFPFCRIEADIAAQLIFPRAISLFRQKNVIGMLPCQPRSDWDKIIDLNILNRPILMYGSVNRPEEPMKTLSNIYGVIERDHLDGVSLSPVLDPDNVFKLNNHSDVMSGNISNDLLLDHDIDYWFPIALSVNYWHGVTRIKEYNQIKPKIQIRVGSSKYEDSDISLAKIFIAMFKKERFNTKIYWIDIGKALWKITEGSDEGLDEWIKLLEKSENSDIDEDLCQELYPTLYDSNITLKTLAWYAKEDASESYENWHKSWLLPSMEESLSGLHTDVSKVLYRCYWLNFVFVPQSSRGGSWYKFRDHRWFRNEMGLDIKSRMSNELITRYDQLRIRYGQEKVQSVNDSVKGLLDEKIKKIGMLVNNLKKVAYKSNILKESQEFFCMENFEVILDQNPMCIAHKNCVTEACDDEIIVRSGKPEDYISKSTAVMYNNKLTWESEIVKNVLKWFGQVFPDKELCDTFIKYGASWYIGGNPEKIIPAFSGCGDNSKSMIVKAFENAFGHYCFKLPTSSLTSTSRSGGANPELAQMSGSRGGFSDELEEEELLKTGFLKRLSGGDSFFARVLYGQGGKVNVMFKLILVCNKIPRMNSVHQSVKARFMVFPFLSIWSDNAPCSEEEQMKQRHFQKNMFFDRQIPKMAPAILWIFANSFHRYIEEGLKIPKIVREITEEYWKDVDIYQMFKDEYIGIAWKDDQKKERNNDARITITDLYAEFKPWFKLNYEGERTPTRRDFKMELVKYYGKPSEDKYYYGLFITTRQAAEEKPNGSAELKNQVSVKHM